MIIAHRNWLDHEASSILIPGRADEGESSSECHATIYHVAMVATNNFKAQSRRLRLDPFELADCILGVRTTEMVSRYGHRPKVKGSRATNQPASRSVVVSTPAMAGNSKTLKSVKPIAVNPQLQELERGRRLKQLHKQELSLAELAGKFGCSKSLIRDLVELASLPKDLEESYIQGTMGRKKVLKIARVRKKQVESKTPVVTPEPQSDGRQNSLPVLTKEEREKKVTENAQLIIDWVHSIGLAPCYWEGLFEQVKLGLHGPFRWLFSAEAPHSNEIKLDGNPWDVINRCKVGRTNPQFVTDVINDFLARIRKLKCAFWERNQIMRGSGYPAVLG